MTLAESAGEAVKLFERAESLWQSYVGGAKAAVREWERLRPLLYERINILKTRIRANLEETQELNIKVELGLIDEAKAKRKLEQLNSETPALIKELGELWVLAEELTWLSIVHLRRLGTPVDVLEEDIEAKARDLEECFRSSMLDKETYEKLKETLAKQLATLKALPPYG